MSKLIFDGTAHQITLYNSKNEETGTWTAYNNTDSLSTVKFLQNGIYNFIEKIAPFKHRSHPEEDTLDGSYGSYGIIHFYVHGHQGVGVHSGRAHHKRLPGPKHWTRGCIRTTDDAMKVISETMALDHLMTVEVKNNSLSVAKQHM